MGSLGDYLMEELSLKTSFTIPIGGGIPVSQSAVTTWVIMAKSYQKDRKFMWKP